MGIRTSVLEVANGQIEILHGNTDGELRYYF